MKKRLLFAQHFRQKHTSQCNLSIRRTVKKINSNFSCDKFTLKIIFKKNKILHQKIMQ